MKKEKNKLPSQLLLEHFTHPNQLNLSFTTSSSLDNFACSSCKFTAHYSESVLFACSTVAENTFHFLST